MPRMMYSKTKAVLAALAVIALPLCRIFGEEPVPGAKSTEVTPGKSEAQKPADRAPEPTNTSEKAAAKRVTGIGGIFIKAQDPARLRAWYKAHLGIDVKAWGGTSFRWVDAAGAPLNRQTAWFV